jgi:SnoaL-like domain
MCLTEALEPYTLRVTHVYRREDGEWKIVHRHADAPLDQSDVSRRRIDGVSAKRSPRSNVSCQDESAQVRHADLGKVVSGTPYGPVGSPAAWRAVA